MRARPRLIVLVGVVVVAVVLGAAVAWLGDDETRLGSAVALAPAGSDRLSWTDWDGVRREVGADLPRTPSTGQVQAFLDEAFERDLTNSSALIESAPSLHEEFGFSPASLSWEFFAQSPDGAVEILGFPESADLSELAGTLSRLGYSEPSSPDGVWRGGGDLLARIGFQLTPELQHFAILEDAHLVLTSDRPGFLEHAVDVVQGDADAVSGLSDVVSAVSGSGSGTGSGSGSDPGSGSGSPLAASVYSGSYACGALAMGTADEDAQAEAEALVERAGEVNPMTGFAMSVQPGGNVRVAMSFEDEDQARANADSRRALASGPAPGQGGDFSDRFTVESAVAKGSTVVLDLDPVEGQYVLSDLSSGPVLFATC